MIHFLIYLVISYEAFLVDVTGMTYLLLEKKKKTKIQMD